MQIHVFTSANVNRSIYISDENDRCIVDLLHFTDDKHARVDQASEMIYLDEFECLLSSQKFLLLFLLTRTQRRVTQLRTHLRSGERAEIYSVHVPI